MYRPKKWGINDGDGGDRREIKSRCRGGKRRIEERQRADGGKVRIRWKEGKRKMGRRKAACSRKTIRRQAERR